MSGRKHIKILFILLIKNDIISKDENIKKEFFLCIYLK